MTTEFFDESNFEFEIVDEQDIEFPNRRSEKIEIDYSKMEFELIDESEFEFSKGGRPKKTQCILDFIPEENRKYWGAIDTATGFDDGYSILFSMVRLRIVKTVSRMIIIELDDDPNFRRLKKEDREFFIKFQNEMLHEKQREWEGQNK
jgi:hypothetical protein